MAHLKKKKQVKYATVRLEITSLVTSIKSHLN